MRRKGPYAKTNESLNEGDALYAELYTRYAKDLYSLGLWLGLRREMIEDAIQDVFIDLYSRRNNLDGINNLKVYLITAFRNRLFSLSSKRQESSIGAEYDTKADEPDYLEYLIEREDETEQQKKMNFLLSKLNKHQREAIYYRFVEGLSCHEVAIALNINYQSTKNLLHRAIKKLREIETFVS